MHAGATLFAQQLRALGFDLQTISDSRLAFAYTIPAGRFIGQTVTLAFDVPIDFERTPPSGPHISPRILPLNPNAPAHPERVAESPVGSQYEYLSRPYTNWGKDGCTVAAYMAFIRHILATS